MTEGIVRSSFELASVLDWRPKELEGTSNFPTELVDELEKRLWWLPSPDGPELEGAQIARVNSSAKNDDLLSRLGFDVL